jgi:lipopolysaccharide export system protein LptA
MMQELLVALFTLTPFSADKVEIIKEQGTSFIHLIGNVVIEDDETKIVCDDARLYEEEDYVVLTDSVVISDKDGSIAADRAHYYFSSKKGYLGGGVRLVSESQVITAESLFYDGHRDYVEMERNIVIEDTEHNMFGYGEVGWYNLQDDIGHLEQAPRIELLREEKDPIYITASQFALYTRENMFYGYDSVVTRIDSITVLCDTFAFNLASDTGTMVRPEVIEDKNVLKGSAGEFALLDDQVDFFSVYYGSSVYHSEAGNVNNVEGDTITIYFEESRAVKIVVNGDPSGVLELKRGSSDTEN